MITFSKIYINPGTISENTYFVLKYRGYNEGIWITISANIIVDVSGSIISMPLPSVDLPEGYYVIRAENEECGVYIDRVLYVSGIEEYIWIEGDGYCEQSSVLNTIRQIAGMSDPYNLKYDESSGRVYGVSWSSVGIGANVFWFNPLTAVGTPDINAVSTVNQNSIFASIIDINLRKIFMTGPKTGGMMVYNIANGSTSQIPYGVDHPFSGYSRLTLAQNGNTLYSFDAYTLLLAIINGVTNEIIETIGYPLIPEYGKRFSDGVVIIRVNNEWWVLASQGSALGAPDSSIGRYNDNFSVLIGTIPLPGQVLWANFAYWRSARLIGNILFVYDMGSNQLLTVNTNTFVVSSVYTFTNRRGKTNSSLVLSQDPITGDLYMSGSWINNPNSDISPIPVSYKLNKDTYIPETIYPNQAFGSNLERIGVTEVLVGAYAGTPVYPSNPAGAATDGTITFFDKSSGTDNTGWWIVANLQEVGASTGIPTGNKKPNNIGDSDYVAPYQRLDVCEIVYTMTCPIASVTIVGLVAEYEYSLPASTFNNPVIDHIDLVSIDNVTSSVLATETVPVNGYQHDYKTKIGGNPNRIDLLFKDASNDTLSTCTNLFTIP